MTTSAHAFGYPGGGTVGPATMAAAAKPDGYTISQIPITVFRLPLMQDVSWNPDKDFTYIVHLTGYTFGVTTNADSQFKTWKDVVDFAKANPVVALGAAAAAWPAGVAVSAAAKQFMVRACVPPHAHAALRVA